MRKKHLLNTLEHPSFTLSRICVRAELMSAEIGTEKVVPRIIEASYQLVNAERISLFIVADNHHHYGSNGNGNGGADHHRSGSLHSQEEDEETNNVYESGAHSRSGAHRRDDSVGHGLASAASLSTPDGTGASASPSSSSKRELVCVVSKDENFKGARIAWGAGIVGHVALTGRSLNIADAYSDPRFDATSDRLTGFVTRCILTVPIHDRDNAVIAVIQAVNCAARVSGSTNGSGGGKRVPASFTHEAQVSPVCFLYTK